MDVAAFAAEAAIEEKHWWFVGRRRLFARLIQGLSLGPQEAILDVGTSTGTNLRLLRDLGLHNVQGLDISPEAIRYCAEKQLGTVARGDVCAMPFASGQFDLVLATDIIEHVEDDQAALSEVNRVLKPGGHALITVPAFPSLWGLQDDVSHHKRRYRRSDLRRRLQAAHLACQDLFYFNYLLFLPIWAARQAIGLLHLKLRSENDVNSTALNWLLTWIFRCDTWSAPYLRPPCGVSIMAMCRKPPASAGAEPLSHVA